MAAERGLTQCSDCLQVSMNRLTVGGETLSVPLRAVAERFGCYGRVVVVNTNYGHACRAGWEAYLKIERREASNGIQSTARKNQGDGTCFGSAVEMCVVVGGAGDEFLDPAALARGATHLFKPKWFPSKGTVQFRASGGPAGARDAVLGCILDYVNALVMPALWADAGFPGDAPAACAPAGPNETVMQNAKFLIRGSAAHFASLGAPGDCRHLVDLDRLREHLVAAMAGDPLVDTPAGPVAVRAPYPVADIDESNGACIKFYVDCPPDKQPSVAVYKGGKINILGGVNEAVNGEIFDFLDELFARDEALLAAPWPPDSDSDD